MSQRALITCFVLTVWFPGTAALWAAEPAPVSAESDPDLEAALRIERAFKKLAKRVEPCVVSLQVYPKPGNWAEDLRRMAETGSSTPGPYGGTGVFIDPAGFIITNEHVVRNARTIFATLADGRVFQAEINGTDPRSDLAMLKLNGEGVPKDLPCAELGDSDTVEAGQWALAVGNPFGMANSFTVGVVSARKRHVNPLTIFPGDVFYGGLIQTDAWINPGNSGGPLFDLRGKLIGINTMILSTSGSHQGCGFAIPSNHLKPRLERLKSGMEIEYGWLGVMPNDFKPGQTAFKVPDNQGVLIERVISDTPADRAGLEKGMVILDYNGLRLATADALVAAVNDTPVGKTVKLKVLDRRGREADFNVKVSKRFSEIVLSAPLRLDWDEEDLLPEDEHPVAKEEKHPPAARPPGTAIDKTFTWRGMLVRERDAAAKGKGRLEIMRVKKDSPADRAGLYEGAIITELKHAADAAIQKINSLEDFKRLTGQITGEAALYIPPEGYVTIEAK